MCACGYDIGYDKHDVKCVQNNNRRLKVSLFKVHTRRHTLDANICMSGTKRSSLFIRAHTSTQRRTECVAHTAYPIYSFRPFLTVSAVFPSLLTVTNNEFLSHRINKYDDKRISELMERRTPNIILFTTNAFVPQIM